VCVKFHYIPCGKKKDKVNEFRLVRNFSFLRKIRITGISNQDGPRLKDEYNNDMILCKFFFFSLEEAYWVGI